MRFVCYVLLSRTESTLKGLITGANMIYARNWWDVFSVAKFAMKWLSPRQRTWTEQGCWMTLGGHYAETMASTQSSLTYCPVKDTTYLTACAIVFTESVPAN